MFVHLNCHSHYSFLRAVPRPEEIIAAACAQKMPAVALTDTNGMYAVVPFYQKAREAGVKPIVGTLLDFEGQDARSALECGVKPLHSTILLLAASHAGYSNLCALVTRRQLENRPVTLEELNEHREGVIALYRSGQGAVTSNPCKKNRRDAGATSEPKYIARLHEIFGDALYLEAQHFPQGAACCAPSGSNVREAAKLSRELGVPLAATNNVHFLKPEEHLHHRVLNAIRTNSLLTKVGPPEIAHPDAYFKSAEEMQRAFSDYPEALRATLEIAERCNLELQLGKTIFPECTVPEGETPFSYLWKLCFEGARQRYKPLRPEVLARLTHELEVINKLHLAPYFLLVWEIVEEARRRAIPAVARGSAASSMVTYCLGISRVCPLRWGLYFERFLNEERGDVPDIDIDICGARRDELLEWVYQRWGAEHVAMIASFITMHARLAVREVAKVFGLSPGEVNHFTSRLPHRPVRDILEALRTLPECRALPAQEEPWKTILQVALRLDGFPRHLGIHPCGTVISAQPLTNLVPLEVATKGIVVTQYDMNAVEALGLVKMDLLGQRGFTTMTLALDNIEKTSVGARHAAPADNNGHDMSCPCVEQEPLSTDRSVCATRIDFDAIPEHDPATCAMLARGRTMTLALDNIRSTGLQPVHESVATSHSHTPQDCVASLDFDAIPEHDPQTCAMLARGRTMGVFQIESPGLRGLLRALEAKTMEDLCLAIAIIRPGAAEYGSKEAFLKRLRGAEPVRYPHPRLEPILCETLGVCVYQEQVMQIAQVAGGLSLAEADLVRRSQAKWADARERERFHSKFLKTAARLGFHPQRREEAWQMVEKFAGFGFCKAHSATYADLAYRMAYLKAHYPAEFLAAMCSSGAGFYHVSAYVEEAKRWGIAVLLPSVNHSRREYTTETRHTLAATVGAQPFAFAQDEQAAPLRSNGMGRALRIGLMQVKGLRLETIHAIVRSRQEHGPYRSLEDFLARVPIERDEIESLIKCGAFDEVCDQASTPCGARPALLWRLNLLWGARGNGNTTPAIHLGELFSDAAPCALARDLEMPSLPDYSREQRLAYEQAILEVCASGHPLDLVARNGEHWSTDVDRIAAAIGKGACPEAGEVGRRVTLLGWLVTFRHVGTKNYRNMMFATFEDQRGLFEVVLFPEAYERYGRWVYEARMLRVTGRVEIDGHVNCEKLEPVKIS